MRGFPWRTVGGVLGWIAGVALAGQLFPDAKPNDDPIDLLLVIVFLVAGVIGGAYVGGRLRELFTKGQTVSTDSADSVVAQSAKSTPLWKLALILIGGFLLLWIVIQGGAQSGG